MSSVPPTAAPSRSGNTIEIVRRSERDQEALESMYADVFGDRAADESRARWRWQYEENPNRDPEGPEIWVAKEDGVVLGQYATMPIRLQVGDRILRASWGMDVMVRPHLQRKGVGSRLFLYWDRHVEASLGLGLSAASYTLFKKLQWEDVGPVPCYSRVLSARALLERRLGRTLAAAAAPLVRLLLAIAFPRRRSRRSLAVTSLDGPFGEEYDALWKRAAPAFELVAERRARYLEWKFHQVPYVSYEVFEARGDAGELRGYVVLRATERNGVKLGLLVDLFAHPEDKAAIGSLLDRSLDWARERGCARMQTFTFDRRIASRLGSKGFMLIPSPMQFCLRIHSDHVDERFFRDTSRWHVTFGDSDQDREP